MKVRSESEVAQSCSTQLSDLMDCSLPGYPSMGFSRQEYWSGLPLYTPKQNQNSPTRYSTTYCTGEQMKPKILSVRTKLTKAQTGKQN